MYRVYVRGLYTKQVLCFLDKNHLISFCEYTCTFVMHMEYGILVVDMVVYDMQV